MTASPDHRPELTIPEWARTYTPPTDMPEWAGQLMDPEARYELLDQAWCDLYEGKPVELTPPLLFSILAVCIAQRDQPAVLTDLGDAVRHLCVATNVELPEGLGVDDEEPGS